MRRIDEFHIRWLYRKYSNMAKYNIHIPNTAQWKFIDNISKKYKQFKDTGKDIELDKKDVNYINHIIYDNFFRKMSDNEIRSFENEKQDFVYRESYRRVYESSKSNTKDEPIVIAVDFDGTIVRNDVDWGIYEELPYCFDVLKALQNEGHILYLWTCREGQDLEDAVNFCKDHDFEFDGINERLDKPSRKIIADIYIDNYSYPNKFKKTPIDWMKIADDFKLDIKSW